MLRRARSLVLPLCTLGAVACGPAFTPFREIEKSRIVGATIEVSGDPTRFTPAPGETATFRLIAADPGPRVGRTFGMVVCVPSPSNLDIVYCDANTSIVTVLVNTTLPGPSDPKPDPSITFTVPDVATLGEADELFLMGAVCNGGTVRDLVTDPPTAGMAWEPCLDDPTATTPPEGQLITTRIPLLRVPEDVNHTPPIVTLQLDGMDFTAVPPDDAPETGCLGQGYPEFYAGGYSIPLTATSAPDARETFFPEGMTTSYQEDLFLYLFRSLGDTDPAYGTIDADNATAELSYVTPPSTDVDPTGTLVRMWIQLKDERGASTYLHRGICVRPL